MKLLHVNKKGIYDLGSGTSSSFNQLAKKIIKYHNKGSIKYIDFPSDLVGKYQHYTKSNNDIIKLIKNFKFTSLSIVVLDELLKKGFLLILPTFLHHLGQHNQG